jgi:hypothetical protein
MKLLDDVSGHRRVDPGFTSTSQQLKRFCQTCGGEMTTSPPISSLQCM